jgi:hypothetical protein
MDISLNIRKRSFSGQYDVNKCVICQENKTDANFESCKILLLTENVEILNNLSLLEVSQKIHRFLSTGFTEFLLEYLDVDGAVNTMLTSVLFVRKIKQMP